MKKALLALLAMGIGVTAFAQATQPCMVMKYNQKEQKTPLGGVEVIVKNAGSQLSDNDGVLTLRFRTLKPGDQVTLISIKKDGFELMNTEAVEQWNITGSQKPFELVMVNSVYFAQLKGKLKQTTTDIYKTKYQQAIKELEAALATAKLKEEEYNKKYDELEAQYQELLKNLDNRVDQFARIDLSQVSPEEQRILDLVDQGLVDQAVAAYNELHLVERLGEETNSYLQLVQDAKRIEGEKKDRHNSIIELYAAVHRQLSTLQLAGHYIGLYNVSTQTLETITPLYDESPEEYRLPVAELSYYAGDAILHNINHYWFESLESGYKALRSSLRYSQRALEEFTILNNQSPDKYIEELAKVNRIIGDVHEKLENHVFFSILIEKYWLDAEYYFRRLSSNNPDLYYEDLTSLIDDLGDLYRRNGGDLEKAISYHRDAIEHYTVLAKNNPEKYNPIIANKKKGLNGLYEAEERKNLDSYYKAMAYLVNNNWLSQKDPYKFVQDIASQYGIYTDRLILKVIQMETDRINEYYDRDDYQGVLEHGLSRLKCRAVLAKQYPEEYGMKWAEEQFYIGDTYVELNDINNAEEYYLTAINNMDQFFQQHPDAITKTYVLSFSRCLEELGDYYKQQNNYSEAEADYLRGFNTLKQWIGLDDYIYCRMAEVKQKMGDLYYSTNNFASAEAAYYEALENWTIWIEKNTNGWRGGLINTLYGLGNACLAQDVYKKDNYSKAEQYFLRALELQTQQNNARSGMAVIQRRLGFLYYSINEYDKAKEYYLLSFDNYSQLFKDSPDSYKSTFASVGNSLSYVYARLNEYPRAIETIDRVIEAIPNDANYYDSKGEILLMSGDEKGAVEMWRKVMELDPDFLSKHKGTTPLYKQLKDRGLIEE